MHAVRFVRDFGTAQDESHLRAVAVPDSDIPAGFDHVGNVKCGFLGS
jgi:hypothetical protein